MKKLIVLLIPLFLFGCAGSRPTTSENEDHSIRYYHVDASNNNGEIRFNVDKEETRTATADIDSKGGTVSPTTDLDAALSQGGSTTSLVGEGGKLLLENVSSAMKYLNERMDQNNQVNNNNEASKVGTITDIPDPNRKDPVDSENMKTERIEIHDRTNGNRPTFYAEKNMKDYPSSFIVEIVGCNKWSVNDNNGTRSEHTGNYLVKQSDVKGRTMAILGPNTCNSTEAFIYYMF